MIALTPLALAFGIADPTLIPTAAAAMAMLTVAFPFHPLPALAGMIN